MRRLTILTVCSALLALTACSSSSGDGDSGGGEIRSEQDVQRLFEAIMPDLIAAFTQLANSQTPAAQASEKQAGSTSVPCPQGGALVVDPVSGMATLSECGASGVIINGSLFLSVVPFGDGTYQAAFSGPLTVSGTFNGMVEVLDSLIEWTDPPSEATTFWSVNVYVPLLNRTFMVMSGTTSDPNQRCVDACNIIQAACGMNTPDCVTDCSSDVAECPEAMGSVLDCVFENQDQLQCDPEQDQGLAEAPCEAQHAAVRAPECDKDPF